MAAMARFAQMKPKVKALACMRTAHGGATETDQIRAQQLATAELTLETQSLSSMLGSRWGRRKQKQISYGLDDIAS